MKRTFQLSVNIRLKPIVILAVFGICSQFGWAEIVPTPANPNVEEQVRLVIMPSGTASFVDWDFGDGSRLRGSWLANHTYTRKGTFTIRVAFSEGLVTLVQTKVLTVQERRRVTSSSQNPRTNEVVTFRALNFLDSRVRWDFGDGTAYMGKNTEEHVYKQPGQYQVTAVDLNGTSLYRFTASVFVTQGAPAAIAFAPEKPRKNQRVSFTAINFTSQNLIRWDFGDGTVIDDSSPPSLSHVFRQPGRYRVRAYDNGGNTVTASVSVRVYDLASITYSPHSAHIDEPVTFRAVNFFSPSVIRWDFGDGTIVNDGSPPTITHSYRSPGVYVIRAYDNAGTVSTATTNISIRPARQVIFDPPNPGVGEPTQFHALNFDANSIRWDFGDGTVLSQAGREVSHTYTREGLYVVTAFDFNGVVQLPVPTSLTVTPVRGPRAPFSISYIQLRFEDGKAYTTVSKGFMDLRAFVDLKYEGTGVFSAYWMVDGAAFQPLSAALPFADQATLDTGREIGSVGLPTLLPGRHEVTLKIINPQTDYTIPVISYYVSPDETVRRLLVITGLEVTGMTEKRAQVAGRTIRAPAGKHFLIKGVVKNTTIRRFPQSLLRIYLEEDLVDQLLFKDLDSLEERPFSSSILVNSGSPRKLYITLYDISQPAAVLQYLMELTVVPIDEQDDCYKP